MYTFLIGIAILFGCGLPYAFLLQKIFKTNKNHKTIAFRKRDKVDYTPMNKYKNAFVQLKSIAGTGPILGPIQGILFGPICFLAIPIGNVLGGVIHDTYSGLISMRNGGEQNPEWIRHYIGKVCQLILLVLTILLSVLLAAVFITMPTKLIVSEIQNAPTIGSSLLSNWLLWVLVILILGYYVVATVFPFDKIIGKLYPTLSVILMCGTLLIFIGCMSNHTASIPEIWSKIPYGDIGLINPMTGHFLPLICVTITCGMLSGFHSTQSTIIGRAVKNEKDTFITFSLPMLIEGVFAMIWAFVALSFFSQQHPTLPIDPVSVIVDSANSFLWNQKWLVVFIILVVSMEAITTGDTTLRSSRLILAEFFQIDQKKMSKRLIVASGCFLATVGLMFWGIVQPSGVNYLWRYFAWVDQTTVVFVLAAVTIYMIRKRLFYWVALIPASFYCFISICFIIGSDKQGINALLPSTFQNIGWTIAYVIGAFGALCFTIIILWWGFKTKKQSHVWIEEKQINWNKR